MYEVRDLTHLKRYEAREKYVYLAHRLFSEQFHTNFFVKDVRSDVYLRNELIAFWEGRIQKIEGWADILGQIKDKILSGVRSILEKVWDSIIKPGVRAIVSAFRWIWDNAVDFAKSAYNAARSAWNVIRSVYNYLRSTVLSLLQSAWSVLRNIGTTIYSYARSAVNVVWTWLLSLYNNYIRPGLQSALRSFKHVWDSAVSFARNAYNKAIELGTRINAIWSDIVHRVSGGFEKVIGAMAALPEAIGSALKNALLVLREVGVTIWQSIIKPVVDAAETFIRSIGEKVSNAASSVFETILNICRQFAPVTPAKAPQLGITLLKVSGASALGLLGMAGVWDLIHPFKDAIPGEIKAMIYDVSNFRMILGGLAGILIGATIRTPFRYAANAMFRPAIPELSDVLELRSRQMLNDVEFARMLRYHGYDDYYHRYFDELAITPLRYFALNAIARNGFYDYEFFENELRRSGYSKEAIKYLHQMYAATANEEMKGMFSSIVVRRYRAGIIVDEQLDSELAALSYPEAQRRKILQGAKLYYDLDTVEDYIKALQYSYRMGKISLEQYAAELAKLGLRSDKIERLVAIERARAKENVYQSPEEEVRATGRYTAIKRYKEGMITDAELEAELRMLGYSDAQIQRLKVLAKLERDYDFAMEVLSAVKAAWRKKKIDDARFIELLRSFGFTDDKIQLELSLLKLVYGLGLSETEVAS